MDDFADDRDDYWKNWRELFNTSMMTKEFFEKYYNKMLEYSPYCENQRFLCMAYYKGLNALRWHASIDDEVSCKTIIESISELEDRINRL